MWTLLYTQAEPHTHAHSLTRSKSLNARGPVQIVYKLLGSCNLDEPKTHTPRFCGYNCCFQLFKCTFTRVKVFAFGPTLTHTGAAHTHTRNRIFHIRFKDVAPRRIANFLRFSADSHSVYLIF